MVDRLTELERYQFAAAECEILAGLAKDSRQRDLYEGLADRYREMIVDLQKPKRVTKATPGRRDGKADQLSTGCPQPEKREF